MQLVNYIFNTRNCQRWPVPPDQLRHLGLQTYLATRYPLDESQAVPSERYGKDEAEIALWIATKVKEWVVLQETVPTPASGGGGEEVVLSFPGPSASRPVSLDPAPLPPAAPAPPSVAPPPVQPAVSGTRAPAVETPQPPVMLRVPQMLESPSTLEGSRVKSSWEAAAEEDDW